MTFGIRNYPLWSGTARMVISRTAALPNQIASAGLIIS